MGVHQHKHEAPPTVRVYVITVSDTRTVEDDKSGRLLRSMFEEAGHHVLGQQIVKDDLEAIRQLVGRELEHPQTQAVVLTGGTGISPRDVTFEAVHGLLSRELPGFGELFRWLSYQEIGSAAILSRAIAGLVGDKVVIAIPGSSAAVRLAMEKLILPELGHMVREATKGLPLIPPAPQV